MTFHDHAAEQEFISQMDEILEHGIKMNIIVDGPDLYLIGLHILFLGECANENKSIFDLKMESELFQRNISEPGVLK